jgi:hypothetical protein
VDGRGRLPLALKLGAETLLTRTLAPDILTGDAAFDHQARITGSEPVALAVLDRETRTLVMREVVHRGAVVEGGCIRLIKPKLGDVAEAIPDLVELAQHLAVSTGDIPRRLARNVDSDLQAGVRVRNLRVLLDHHRDHEVTPEVCRRALGSPYPSLRVEAGIGLGEEGVTALCELARDESVDEELRVRAVEHLIRSGSSGRPWSVWGAFATGPRWDGWGSWPAAPTSRCSRPSPSRWGGSAIPTPSRRWCPCSSRPTSACGWRRQRPSVRSAPPRPWSRSSP